MGVGAALGTEFAGTDVGSTHHDIQYFQQENNWVLGLPAKADVSGDTPIMVRLEINMGLKASVRGESRNAAGRNSRVTARET